MIWRILKPVFLGTCVSLSLNFQSSHAEESSLTAQVSILEAKAKEMVDTQKTLRELLDVIEPLENTENEKLQDFFLKKYERTTSLSMADAFSVLEDIWIGEEGITELANLRTHIGALESSNDQAGPAATPPASAGPSPSPSATTQSTLRKNPWYCAKLTGFTMQSAKASNDTDKTSHTPLDDSRQINLEKARTETDTVAENMKKLAWGHINILAGIAGWDNQFKFNELRLSITGVSNHVDISNARKEMEEHLSTPENATDVIQGLNQKAKDELVASLAEINLGDLTDENRTEFFLTLENFAKRILPGTAIRHLIDIESATSELQSKLGDPDKQNIKPSTEIPPSAKSQASTTRATRSIPCTPPLDGTWGTIAEKDAQASLPRILRCEKRYHFLHSTYHKHDPTKAIGVLVQYTPVLKKPDPEKPNTSLNSFIKNVSASNKCPRPILTPFTATVEDRLVKINFRENDPIFLDIKRVRAYIDLLWRVDENRKKTSPVSIYSKDRQWICTVDLSSFPEDTKEPAIVELRKLKDRAKQSKQCRS